jgi:hypothetical protein
MGQLRDRMEGDLLLKGLAEGAKQAHQGRFMQLLPSTTELVVLTILGLLAQRCVASHRKLAEVVHSEAEQPRHAFRRPVEAS